MIKTRILRSLLLVDCHYPLRVLAQLGMQVEPGHTVLVHAAAGGVGSLLCQWANALGATAIGTVSSEEKAAQAREDGCTMSLSTPRRILFPASTR